MPLSGRRQFMRRMHKLSDRQIAEVVGQSLFEGADLVKAEAQNLITRGSASGRRHVASSPGEPPNNDTGVLMRGIVAKRTGALTAEVRSEAPYSAALERGTSKMAARPFMRPARDNSRKKIRDHVTKKLDVFLKKVAR